MILIIISGVYSLSESHLIQQFRVSGNPQNSWASITEPNINSPDITKMESNTSKISNNMETRVDKFGTKELYPTKVDGKEWFSKWDNGKSRAFFSEESDPYDNEFKLRGDGKIVIDG